MTQPAPFDLNADVLSPVSVRKAAEVVSDIIECFAPLHDIKPQDWISLAPILLTVESVIYQLDGWVEQQAIDIEAANELVQRVLQRYWLEHGVYDDRIGLEFSTAINYWQVESKLLQGGQVDEHDVRAILYWKSFDFRLLNLILFRFTGRPYDELLLELWRIVESIFEIEDDIKDYSEDLASGDMNLLALMISLYGSNGAVQLQKMMDDFHRWGRKAEAELASTQPDRYAIWARIAMEGAPEPLSSRLPMSASASKAPAQTNAQSGLAISMATVHARWPQLLQRAQLTEPDLMAASKLVVHHAHEWLFMPEGTQ